MKYQPDQSIVDYNDWDLATSSVITGDFTTDSLKYGFGPTTLRAESFNWLPKGNWVDLGYDNAPTESQLRSQIEAGDHNDPYGNLGCPNCGNVDLFWKKITSKGKTFRCLSCEWADNYETVKSQGDITLQKFGLTVDCPLCGETISAYNRASIDSHFRKHKKEAAESKVSEAENSEPEWQDDIKWNDKPKKKIEPEWDDVEWESETRKCCECGTTESLATIQAGTFCYECLPINLGAEVHLLPDAPMAGWYDRHDDSVNINLANKGIRNEALEDNYSGLFDTIAHEYGHQVTSHETRSPYHSEFAAFMVQTNGDFARSKLLAVIHPTCFHEIIMKLPPDSDGMISDETLDNFFSTLDLENNMDILTQAKRFVTYPTIPEWHKDWLKHFISYVETGTSANVSFEAEADDYWAGSVAKAIVNEMGDDYYDEDLHEYNCVHFAQEMSGYLAQDGIPHEIQSIAGYGGEVAHAWVYVPSEKEYYDAWTPYGVSDWKDLGFWETLDYTPEWLEQQTPESFAAEEKQEVPRYVYHATPELYWEQIKEQGGMIPQIGYMTYRAFLPRYKQAHIGQDISPEHYKQWIVKELGGLKIWATSQSKVMIYASQIEPMSLLPDNVVLKIDTEGLDFQYYNYEEFFTQKPIPLSAIEVAFRINGERSKEEYPDYLLPNLDPSLQNILEDEPELLETHPELFRDENYERFVAAAEENYNSKLFSSIVKDIWNRFSVMRLAVDREEYLQREISEPIRLNSGYAGRNKEANDRYFQAITIEDTDLRYYIDEEWDDGPVEFNKLTQESLKRVEDLQNDLRTKYNNPSIKLEVQMDTTVDIEGSGVFVVEISMNANTESFEAEDNYDSTYGKAQAKIRRKLKKKIKKQAIMGTKAGQWSARKSQELKRQYEAACSKKGLKPYKGQKTKKQQDLTDWSKQGWRTASGKKSSTTGEPYFPAKAVAALKQKKLYAKAKRQKQAATKAGKQNARYSDDIRAVVKQYRAEESKEVSPSQLLNWIAQPTVLRIKIPAEVKHEPLFCVMCSSRNLEANEMDRIGDGTIHSYVNCRDCGCVWREDFLYNDYEIIDEGQTTSLSSETIIDDEQLILEIEGIDESYGLDTPDSQILSIAESAVSQYLSRPDLPESFKLVSQPHFVFVVPDAFARSSHVARFRSQTASHIPIIMLSSEAIRESADRYGVSLETGVTTTVWHELGHVLCELWDMEEIYPFDDGNQEEEFAESIAESMYFQEPFQNPVF